MSFQVRVFLRFSCELERACGWEATSDADVSQQIARTDTAVLVVSGAVPGSYPSVKTNRCHSARVGIDLWSEGDFATAINEDVHLWFGG